jgi:hypothetical protein
MTNDNYLEISIALCSFITCSFVHCYAKVNHAKKMDA